MDKFPVVPTPVGVFLKAIQDQALVVRLPDASRNDPCLVLPLNYTRAEFFTPLRMNRLLTGTIMDQVKDSPIHAYEYASLFVPTGVIT